MLLLILISYFGLGLLALCVLDLATGRIRNKFRSASIETQMKLISTGNYVGSKSSVVITLIALWLLWPIAIYGALSSPKGKELDGQEG